MDVFGHPVRAKEIIRRGRDGHFVFRGKRLTDIAHPEEATDAVSKRYVDEQIAKETRRVAVKRRKRDDGEGDFDIEGKKLTRVGEPEEDGDVVTLRFTRDLVGRVNGETVEACRKYADEVLRKSTENAERVRAETRNMISEKPSQEFVENANKTCAESSRNYTDVACKTSVEHCERYTEKRIDDVRKETREMLSTIMQRCKKGSNF